MGLNVPLGAVNTFVLITSSVTMVMSWAALMEKNFAKFRMFLGTTIALAIAFLVVKGFEYAAKFSAGHFPKTDPFFATYFTLTGLHALHVICGIIVLGVFCSRREDVENRTRPFHTSYRSGGPLLALRGSRLDFPFSDVVSFIIIYPIPRNDVRFPYHRC